MSADSAWWFHGHMVQHHSILPPPPTPTTETVSHPTPPLLVALNSISCWCGCVLNTSDHFLSSGVLSEKWSEKDRMVSLMTLPEWPDVNINTSPHTHTHTHDQTTDGAQNHVRDRESVHRGPSALLECQQATEQSLDANRRLSRARGIRVFTNSVRKEGWLEQHTELHFISLDIYKCVINSGSQKKGRKSHAQYETRPLGKCRN